MNLTIDDTGGRVDWTVAQNCVWRSDFVSSVDGVVEDITSATIVAKVTASSTSAAALKTFTVTKTDATAGAWKIVVADSDADLAPGTYWWAMDIDTGDGDEPVMSGEFVVEAWVA